MTTLDVKAAVALAMSEMRELFSLAARDLRLEEVRSSDTGEWLITVSSPDPDDPYGMVGPMSGKRVYRVVRIDPSTSKVLSITLRQFE